VSVYWLQQETVFGCTVSKKDSLSVSLIERESASKCVYSIVLPKYGDLSVQVEIGE
jgi:hypothetical protein